MHYKFLLTRIIFYFPSTDATQELLFHCSRVWELHLRFIGRGREKFKELTYNHISVWTVTQSCD